MLSPFRMLSQSVSCDRAKVCSRGSPLLSNHVQQASTTSLYCRVSTHLTVIFGPPLLKVTMSPSFGFCVILLLPLRSLLSLPSIAGGCNFNWFPTVTRLCCWRKRLVIWHSSIVGPWSSAWPNFLIDTTLTSYILTWLLSLKFLHDFDYQNPH